jgi:hypothetical protein
MSAEPAPTGPDRSTHAATVLQFPSAPRPRLPRSERTPVPPPSDPGTPLDPEQQLAAVVEQVFASIHRTLTDDDTAEVYLTTLRVVANLFDGALAQGVVDDEAHRTLVGMLQGMEGVPRTLG